MKQRVAARLLLATCTLALGVALGTGIAVTGVLTAIGHPRIELIAPGRAEGRLDRGPHDLSVRRDRPGGGLPLSESRPDCTLTDLRTGQPAEPTSADGGFAAVRIKKGGGAHRLECSSAAPVTVGLDHRDTEIGGSFRAIGRGLLVAVILTVLAAVLAARALLAARRLRVGPEGPVSPPS